MTADILFFDECQDMFPQTIGNAQKILTASKYGPTGKGVQVFFGTPKQRNSYFSTIGKCLIKNIIILVVINAKLIILFTCQMINDGWIYGFLGMT